MRSSFDRLLRSVILICISLAIAVAAIVIGPPCLLMGLLGLSGQLADDSREFNVYAGLQFLGIAAGVGIVAGLWFLYALRRLWNAP